MTVYLMYFAQDRLVAPSDLLAPCAKPSIPWDTLIVRTCDLSPMDIQVVQYSSNQDDGGPQSGYKVTSNH